jgi:polyisoprenoid-binding protein YceI
MAATTWVLDPTHSLVQFKVRHMMIANTTGTFTKYTVSAETEGEDFNTAKVSFTAETDSVDTGNPQRDEHLKSADFFDSAKFPELKFVATKYENVDNDGSYELYGDITIHGVTKAVKFDVEFGGVVKDPWGNTRAGFAISGKINRKDFGLVWNAATEAGGIVVGEDVKVHVEIELIKQA